ncbi:MAG TPA: nitrogen fixation protein NifZ [Rhodocyclaceae bacterium]|nr:nitrogen fixation protein NifZ [Rhodocyclaceae bacterium]
MGAILTFGLGDVVIARDALYNDGGIPDIDADALLAGPGSRGVVVKAGHVEAAPDQEIYLVRFEDANGVLGPPVGCLPEELIQQE